VFCFLSCEKFIAIEGFGDSLFLAGSSLLVKERRKANSEFSVLSFELRSRKEIPETSASDALASMWQSLWNQMDL